MGDQGKPGKDAWEQLRELERQVEEEGELDPGQWREFLLHLGPTLGIARDAYEAAVATAQGAAALVREARRRIDEDAGRFSDACHRAAELRARGRRAEARQVFREILQQEPASLYRENAERELEKLASMRVIAEREYGFVGAGSGPPEKVTLRVGAPEQDDPSTWVLPFEIVGPGQQRIDRAVPAADAVQALQAGLQRIPVELRSMQDSAGGKLVFLGEEALGFALPNIPGSAGRMTGQEELRSVPSTNMEPPTERGRMDDQGKPGKDAWEQLRELERQVEEDGELDPGQWREFLLHLGPTLGLARDACEAAVATAQGAAALVREARRRIDEGNERVGAALRRAKELHERGRRKEAQQVFREVLQQEPVSLFRDVAEHKLKQLASMRVIAEREYGFVGAGSGPPEKVTLRVGAPEQDDPSTWVLPFEILGPGQQRIDRAVPAADAVQALQWGLQRIPVELRWMQASAGDLGSPL